MTHPSDYPSLSASDEASAAVQKTHNRVSLPAMIDKVNSVEYHNPDICPHMTIAMVEMANGFIVVGKSAPADPENFDAEVGRKFAFEDAMRQVWQLEGYRLREDMTRETNPARGIQVSINLSAKRDYMAAYVSYPAQPGETWRRSNDLPDGKATPETLARIFNAIAMTLAEEGVT